MERTALDQPWKTLASICRSVVMFIIAARRSVCALITPDDAILDEKLEIQSSELMMASLPLALLPRTAHGMIARRAPTKIKEA